MKFDLADCVQRAHRYAIVDEVDSILIDEARTPLIISGSSEESTDKYYKVDKVIPLLQGETDYEVDEKLRTATITEAGFARAEKALGLEDLSDPPTSSTCTTSTRPCARTPCSSATAITSSTTRAR